MTLLKEFLQNVTVYQNVSDYNFTIGDNNHWTVITNNQNVTNNPSVYFITEFYDKDSSIAHWIFESAILIQYYQLLKSYIPNLKWHVKVKKSFKNLFFDKYCVSENDIVYEMNKSNVCFFVKPWTLNNNKDFESKSFETDLGFLTRSFDFTELNKPTKLLYIAHKNKENYSGNAREYDLDEFINVVRPKVLYTDQIQNIDEQCNIVRSAETIIVHAGSAYFINGLLFAKNSNIVVVDTSLQWQIETFKALNLIDKQIKKRNKEIKYIDYNNEITKNLISYLYKNLWI